MLLNLSIGRYGNQWPTKIVPNFLPFPGKRSIILNFRTMDFIYQEESKVQDIDTYRFIIDSTMFSSSLHDNCGYCRKLPRDMYGREAGSYCLPDGILDLSGCEQCKC
jgi:hypothetical protein